MSGNPTRTTEPTTGARHGSATTDHGPLVRRAAAPLLDTVRALDTGALRVLTAGTPCTGWDVRRLVNHLLFWGPPLAGAGRKAAVPPPAAGEEVDLTAAYGAGGWAGALAASVQGVVDAWTDQAAWEGVTTLGAPPELPAPVIGGMVLGELVVHGWDLAAALGRPVGWDDEVLGLLHATVAGTAEQGRAMGVYGPAVTVPDDAPLLDRVLGLTGRAASWSPSAATS